MYSQRELDSAERERVDLTIVASKYRHFVTMMAQIRSFKKLATDYVSILTFVLFSGRKSKSLSRRESGIHIYVYEYTMMSESKSFVHSQKTAQFIAHIFVTRLLFVW